MGKLDYRDRVRAGARQVALRDEAFRAKVEQLEPCGDVKSGFRKRLPGDLDRLRVLARPREVTETLDQRRLRDSARLDRASCRCLRRYFWNPPSDA